MIRTISAQELKDLMARQEIELVDVREAMEHQTGIIDGAHLIPLAQVTIDKISNFEKPIVFYCRSGKRSFYACEKMLEEGYAKDIYSLDGGILAWNYSKNKNSKSCNFIPLDRQMQLFSGSLILMSFFLGTYVSSLFFALCAFVGTGLLMSGLFGICPGAMIIERMPWNRT